MRAFSSFFLDRWWPRRRWSQPRSACTRIIIIILQRRTGSYNLHVIGYVAHGSCWDKHASHGSLLPPTPPLELLRLACAPTLSPYSRKSWKRREKAPPRGALTQKSAHVPKSRRAIRCAAKWVILDLPPGPVALVAHYRRRGETHHRQGDDHIIHGKSPRPHLHEKPHHSSLDAIIETLRVAKT
jgi:hypothetical protein